MCGSDYIKKKFNIHLSSRQTNSFSGPLYNARYFINLRGHVDESDFSKAWDVYMTFHSDKTTDLTTATGINPLESYAMHLDIGPNFINAAAFRERNTPLFIMYQESFTNGATVYTGFSTGNTDNSPIRINSLYNVSYINFEIFNINGQTICNSTANYHIILHFCEA